MLVLLPPSEGKAQEGSGAALDLGSLSLPGLTETRRTVLDELVGLCSGDPDKALDVLGLGAKLRGEVAKNAELRSAPTLPAGELYTGVLYDALGLSTLDAGSARRARDTLLIFSGLWGALRVDDPVPSYRCSMGVKLPALGALGAYWRAPLAEVLPEAAGDGLVLDLRSAAYATAWKPKGELAKRTVTGRVLQVRTVDGMEKRSVVSHFNKATKGRLVRALLTDGATPRDPAELCVMLRDLGFTVETPAPGKLDVLVTEV
ncbi:peroxide stress protein YaaA [Streptantibioticus rubrisoli]|uniref:Peroxide stress protein YaaA n=1 Tax=Streptantibioticus rubrisoli TaxID=1387313 RepID=A0ABT1PHQ0_9ACTN|nr:peroxide stress protein YaaA [Streptantibioticus rubrisoli]MCQ4044886.1 peroxide stress protein YaaA [Streptantibioticus rubrisoli]